MMLASSTKSSSLKPRVVAAGVPRRMPEVTDGVIRASREAVVLAVSLVGVTGFWAGLMEIAKKAMPMIVYFLIALLLITFVPQLSLALL